MSVQSLEPPTAASAARDQDVLHTPASARLVDRSALASVVLLALWIGAALLMVSTVAPGAFRALPSRALAGAVVGQILPVLFLSGIAVGGASLALTMRAARFARIRQSAAVGTLIGCTIAQFVIGPKISAVRAAIGPSVEALAASDPLRVSFGRLHAFSVLWLGVAMLCAVVMLVATTRALTSPRR